MPEKIFIGVAWPYANGSLHTGQIVGAYLPADIFARYHRVVGNEVLMVSGSDQHGTPITVRADDEGVKPEHVVERFHREFVDCWRRLGISFDLFTTTGTVNHAATTHEMFRLLREGDYIYRSQMYLPYCTADGRFLPDRYIEGTCPTCGRGGARGDQCDGCGRTLNAVDLVEMRCRMCGVAPEIRQSEHYFLRLSAFNDRLKEWVNGQEHWRKSVFNWTRGILKEGLQDRAITRDIDWGVSVPEEGFEGKRIYVWFEAVIGYLSAAKEWSAKKGDPEGWREFWQGGHVRSFYFIGKDNIPFHTLIWPAMLMGCNDSASADDRLNVPYDVPANQYQTVRGSKASTSRNLAIWLPDYLSRYDADPLRYYLSANMPEAADADFTWHGFLHNNNDELVATWGNLAHRILTFTQRYFQGRVPDPGILTPEDQAFIRSGETALSETGNCIGGRRFRAGIEAAMQAVRNANRYIEEQAPWRLVREDPARCATVIYAGIAVVDALKVAFYPYLPFSSQTLHEYLGHNGRIEEVGWRSHLPSPGCSLPEPAPLFRKLEPSLVEEEEARLGY